MISRRRLLFERPMFVIGLLALALLLSLSFSHSKAAGAPSPSIAGTWDSVIDIPEQPLQMVMEFTEHDDGTVTGAVDIPVQNAFGLELVNIIIDGTDVSFAFADIPAAVKGTLSPEGIQGTFEQSGMAFPFQAQLRSDDEWDENRTAELRQLIETVMDDWNVSGVSVAVVQHGEIVFAEGFGLRDVENNLPVTPNTLFGIGSATKAFTTTAMQMFVDEGVFDWDQPIREILPGFRLQDPFATEHISAVDFALHRSGLPRHDMPWMFNPEMDKDAFIAEAEHLTPVTGFRTGFIYNNFGYMVLGRMIEEASGKSWEETITERILMPLGMNDTYFTIEAMQSVEDFAHAYTFNEEQYERVDLWEIGAATPAGAINASVIDMAKWIRFHMQKGKIDDEQLVSHVGMQQMHSPYIVFPAGYHPEIMLSSYGLGWMIDSYRGHYRVQHGGNTLGFSAQAGFLPQEDIGFVVLTNGVFTPLPDVLTNYVLDYLLDLEPIDWNNYFKGMLEMQLAAMNPSELGKRDGTVPSHPLHEYTGLYEHPTYGQLEITLVDDTLRARYYQAVIPLNHWHFDQFHGPMHPLVPIDVPFFFITDAIGEISQVNVGMEPTVDPIPFTRSPATELQNEHYLSQFVGEYEALGATFEVTLDNEVLILHVPGQPPYRLAPMREGRFVFKDHDGFGLNFEFNEDGTFESVVMIQPHGNIELHKK